MSFLTVLGSSEQWITREMVAPRAKKGAKSVEANDRFNIERRFPCD
jgi:hypothetical protein